MLQVRFSAHRPPRRRATLQLSKCPAPLAWRRTRTTRRVERQRAQVVRTRWHGGCLGRAAFHTFKETRMKTLARATSLALLAVASGAAFAQAGSPEPDYQLTYNVGVVSDYRVRGIAQTAFKPALQAGIDFAHKSGFYAGTFASNVRWIKDFNLATKGAVEVDLYGGYKGAINSDFSYDLGVITY